MPIALTDALALFEKLLSLPLEEATVAVLLASSPGDALEARFERLQIAEKLAGEFRGIATATLARLRREQEGGHLLLREYRLQSKPDRHEVEYLCVPEIEALQGQLQPLGSPATLDLFQEDPAFVAGLRFYATSLLLPGREPVHFIRRYSPEGNWGARACWRCGTARGSTTGCRRRFSSSTRGSIVSTGGDRVRPEKRQLPRGVSRPGVPAAGGA